MTGKTALTLGEEQVLWFRARRGHLAGRGAGSAAAAARDILGAQSQQLLPSLLALSQRTRSRPTRTELEEQLLGEHRALVRTWGQRGTVHVYRAEDWACVIRARREWGRTGRRGSMPPAPDLAKARRLVASAAGTVTRRDFFDLASPAFREEVRAKLIEVGMAHGEEQVLRFCAGRMIWRLAHEGVLSFAERRGQEQFYAARRLWFPDLAWSAEEPRQAALRLARRYLATYGPATAADVGHFFGAPVTVAREWLGELGEKGELLAVECGERAGLRALATDRGNLGETPPSGFREWPLRLLPTWDTVLMGHADKSWLVLEQEEKARIWRRAAFVAPVVVVRGRIVATWSHRARGRRLEVTVEPLSRWRAVHAGGVRREARAVAAHLGCSDVDVRVEAG